MPAPAYRLTTLPPYPFATLNQRIREMNQRGLDVISVDIGSPDMPPPDCVIEALDASAHRTDRHGYAGYKGTADFRAAVADYYKRRFGVTVDPEREVLPLLGSKEGIVNLSLAYLDRGDAALVPEAAYPAYDAGALLAGAETRWLPMHEQNGFLPDFDHLPIATLDRAKLMWVNYPNNPTGATADLDFYQRAVAFCAQHNLLLASDNPYADVTFDGYQAGSALAPDNARDHVIEFISFSKTFNMAGWRLGAAVGSTEAIKTLLQVKSNMDSGHFHAIYDAGIVALTQVSQTWIDQRNAVYQRRRDCILDTLPHIGLTAIKPKGSLYIWARVVPNGALQDGVSYAEQALNGARVSLAPGEFYGPGGKDYVRFSIAIPDARLEEALDRLKTWYTSV